MQSLIETCYFKLDKTKMVTTREGKYDSLVDKGSLAILQICKKSYSNQRKARILNKGILSEFKKVLKQT